MTLYRVFPYDSNAAPTERGGALYVPPANSGRISNPELYAELYLAGTAEAAVAETFGRLPMWKAADFTHADGNPLALAAYRLNSAAKLFDLNDIAALKKLEIAKPTDVVTRERKITRAWARKIFEMGGYDGASWWSFYNPEWAVYGVWTIATLSRESAPEPLHTRHPAVTAAATSIVRQIA